MRDMAQTQQTETKSLAPAQTEDKAVTATETKSDEKDAPKGVKFTVAHPLDKAVVEAGAEGKYKVGEKITVPEHVASHLAAIGAGRRA